MQISMGRRKVGEGEPAYIVFEAGPTHTGLASAKTLARHAREAGADAIKFQIADHHRLIAEKDLPFTYSILVDRERNLTRSVTEPLIDIWQRRFMPPEDWRNLKAYCDEVGIDFFATAFSEEVVDFLVEIGCHMIKIASQDVNYRDLVRHAAGKGVPIQIDTGAATLGEVERAVDWIRAEGNERIIINHCPSGYPARLDSINLRTLKTLRQMFPYPIAFSDHTPGWVMDVAALAMGADVIEKTITLDRTTPSCEHMMSLEPQDMAAFVVTLREVEKAMGHPRRIMSPEEIQRGERVRRSAHLTREVKAGESLARGDIDFRRPGHGIRPDEYHHYLGMRFTRPLPAGQILKREDLL